MVVSLWVPRQRVTRTKRPFRGDSQARRACWTKAGRRTLALRAALSDNGIRTSGLRLWFMSAEEMYEWEAFLPVTNSYTNEWVVTALFVKFQVSWLVLVEGKTAHARKVCVWSCHDDRRWRSGPSPRPFPAVTSIPPSPPLSPDTLVLNVLPDQVTPLVSCSPVWSQYLVRLTCGLG